MEEEYPINELLAKIDKLSCDIDKYQQEINLLKAQATKLQKNGQVKGNTEQSSALSSFIGFENFIGLKLIHFVGIVVLIIGLTIGVKYAIDIHLISPAMRVALAYLASCVLFFTAIRLRKKYELFSMILFSGSMASAYFTTYAAFGYYELISRLSAFGLMLVFTFFTVYNSFKYKREEIAILGLVGAYGIPFFVRGNSDNALALFSYVFLINIGVLLISFKKYWISLTYVSFFTTWLIYLTWAIIYSGNKAFYPKLYLVTYFSPFSY